MNNLTIIGLQKDCVDCEGLPLRVEPCYICYGIGWFLEPFFPQEGSIHGTVTTHGNTAGRDGNTSVEVRPDISEEDFSSLIVHTLFDDTTGLPRVADPNGAKW